MLLVLGEWFGPVYLRDNNNVNIYTTPQYLGYRFIPAGDEARDIKVAPRRLQVYFASMTLLFYMLSKTSVRVLIRLFVLKSSQTDLLAAHLLVEQIFGIDLDNTIQFIFFFVSFVLLIIACVLVALGGARAVIFTDALQVFVMLVGGAVLSVFGRRLFCNALSHRLLYSISQNRRCQ